MSEYRVGNLTMYNSFYCKGWIAQITRKNKTFDKINEMLKGYVFDDVERLYFFLLENELVDADDQINEMEATS